MIPEELWLNMVKGKAVSEYRHNKSEFGYERGSDEWLGEMNQYTPDTDEWLMYNETILELKETH